MLPGPEVGGSGGMWRERVLFIGTQFSILYTSMYSPAEAATLVRMPHVGFDGTGAIVANLVSSGAVK